MPVSFLLFGWLMPLIGKRSVADYLAMTLCIQEYSSISDEPEERGTNA
jgi:hypothetical protein